MKGCKDRPPCCWFCIVFTLEGEHEQEWRERDKQSSGSLPSDNIFLGFLFAIHRFYLSPFASLGAYQQEYSKLAVALAKGTTVPQKLRDLFSQGSCECVFQDILDSTAQEPIPLLTPSAASMHSCIQSERNKVALFRVVARDL